MPSTTIVPRQPSSYPPQNKSRIQAGSVWGALVQPTSSSHAWQPPSTDARRRRSGTLGHGRRMSFLLSLPAEGSNATHHTSPVCLRRRLTLRTTPRRRVLDLNQPPFRGTPLQERRLRSCQEALTAAVLRSARNLALNSSRTLRMSARRASSSCFFSAIFFPRAG